MTRRRASKYLVFNATVNRFRPNRNQPHCWWYWWNTRQRGETKRKKIMKIKRSLTTCAVHWKVSHLCIGKSKLSRNFISVGRREIFLIKEPLLQLKYLREIHIYLSNTFFILYFVLSFVGYLFFILITWWLVKAVRDFLFFFGGCLFAKFNWARSISETCLFEFVFIFRWLFVCKVRLTFWHLFVFCICIPKNIHLYSWYIENVLFNCLHTIWYSCSLQNISRWWWGCIVLSGLNSSK